MTKNARLNKSVRQAMKITVSSSAKASDGCMYSKSEALMRILPKNISNNKVSRWTKLMKK